MDKLIGNGMDDYAGLKSKVKRYNEILANTKAYRERWNSHLKNLIVSELETMVKVAGLNGKIEFSDKVKHLEYVILSLGSEESGISEIVDEKIEKPLIKKNGSLIYQQLFNGKVQVMVVLPFIEGFGDPSPPKVIGIYRPEEIKPPFLIRHMEDFVKEITQWEDFDDDDQIMQKIGFNVQHLPKPDPSDE
jgi:hypothetical protein